MVLLVSIAALARGSMRPFPGGGQDKPPVPAQLKNADLVQIFESGTIMIGDSLVFTRSYARLYLRGGIVHQFYSGPDGNGDYVRGNWRIDQDALCIKWQSAGTGQPGEQCSTINKLADGSYESWFEGKRVGTFQLKPPPKASALKPAG
jgi:hypothetical protein